METEPRPGPFPDDDEPTVISPRPSTQTIGGRYHLDRRLASGAFGVVYEGHYQILDQKRRVAVKVLKSGAGADADRASVARFREEVRTLTLLNHPNICKVIDGGVSENGAMFLVMEFAEGGSLKAQMQASPDKRVPPRTAIRWMREAALGLLAAEQNQSEGGKPAPVYHRDVKPENLLLQSGRVVVADFGAAKLGGDNPGITSEICPALWTPGYGSPEQAIGIVDHRSDIYALGTTFYHLLTGQLPQARFKDPEQRYSEAHDPNTVVPRSAKLPKGLCDIVRKMTEPNPAQRYQSFEELVAALNELERETRPARLPWFVLGALLLAATTTAVLQLAGVIDLFATTTIIERPKPADLSSYERALADPLYDTPADSVAAELREALAAMQSARNTLRDQLQSVAPETVTAAELASLTEQSFALRTARELYDEAVNTLAAYAAAEAARATQSCGQLRSVCRPNRVADRFPALETRRLALVKTIDSLEAERERQVRSLTQAFTTDTTEPSAVASAAALLATQLEKCNETGLAQQARNLERDARAAIAHEAALQEWRPSAPDLSGLGTFTPAIEALASTEFAETVLLATWWSQRRAAMAMRWSERCVQQLRAVYEDLERQIGEFNGRSTATTASPERDRLAQAIADFEAFVRALQVLARRLQTPMGATLLQEDMGAMGLPRLVDLRIEGPRVPNPAPRELPDGWPNAAYQPPPAIRSLRVRADDPECQRLYPADFLRDAEANGMHLWYFDKRRTAADKRVYMVYCPHPTANEAWLIDVHPVTLDEVRATTNRNFLTTSDYYPKEFDRRSAATIFNDASLLIGTRFAEGVATAITKGSPPALGLPPAGLRQWDCAARFGPPGEPPPKMARGVFPVVSEPMTDVSKGGLGLLRSGVSEWPRGGTAPEGTSQIALNPTDAARRQDSGFRLALQLLPW